MKKASWKKLVFDLSFWLIAEVVLNIIGIDDLADYNEFLLGQKSGTLYHGAIAKSLVIDL